MPTGFTRKSCTVLVNSLLHQGQRARWGPPGRPGICSAQAAALLARRVVLCASPLTCGSRRCNPSVKHSGLLCPQQPIVALYRPLCSVPGRPAHIGKPLETPWCYSCATAQSRQIIREDERRVCSGLPQSSMECCWGSRGTPVLEALLPVTRPEKPSEHAASPEKSAVS
jgi:hypothetical protein